MPFPPAKPTPSASDNAERRRFRLLSRAIDRLTVQAEAAELAGQRDVAAVFRRRLAMIERDALDGDR